MARGGLCNGGIVLGSVSRIVGILLARFVLLAVIPAPSAASRRIFRGPCPCRSHGRVRAWCSTSKSARPGEFGSPRNAARRSPRATSGCPRPGSRSASRSRPSVPDRGKFRIHVKTGHRQVRPAKWTFSDGRLVQLRACKNSTLCHRWAEPFSDTCLYRYQAA
jgi:hypothetical protein